MDIDELIANLRTRRQIRVTQLEHWRAFADPAWEREIESILAAIEVLEYVKKEYATYGQVFDQTRSYALTILAGVNIFTLGIDENE